MPSLPALQLTTPSPDRPRQRTQASFELLADGSGVVVDGRTGSAYGLNATAALVWELCDGQHSTGEIVAALLEHFEASPEQVERGVRAILAELRRLDVLEPAGPTRTRRGRPSHPSGGGSGTAAGPAAGADRSWADLPHRRSYGVMGLSVEVGSDSAEFCAALDRLNAEFGPPPPGQPAAVYEVRAPTSGKRWRLRFQGADLARACESLLAAVGYVEWHICDQAIDRRHDLLHMHGAALAGAEASVLLPGRHGIGKTTLALAMALGGMRLLSDDIVFIQPRSWRPEPFPRSLLLRKGTLDLLAPLAPRPLEAHRLGSHLCATALGPWGPAPGPPLRYVVFPRFSEDGRLALEPIAAAEAAVELMRYSKNLRRFERFGLDLIPRLLEQVECYVLQRGQDLAAAARLLQQLVR